MYIYDLTGLEYDNVYFGGANIGLIVCCDNCESEFEETVYVTGNPIWNYENIDEGRVPKVEIFEGCEVKCLSGKQDTSFQECFIDEKMYSENINFASNETTKVKFEQNLKIIAKTE